MDASKMPTGIKARQDDVIMQALDPLSTEKRKSRSLIQRAYYSKGPNYIWHLNGYDKIKPFDIAISVCIYGFSRKHYLVGYVYHQ